MKPPADTSRPGWFSRWRLATRLTVAVVALALPLELLVIGSAINGVLERRNAELDNAVLVLSLIHI